MHKLSKYNCKCLLGYVVSNCGSDRDKEILQNAIFLQFREMLLTRKLKYRNISSYTFKLRGVSIFHHAVKETIWLQETVNKLGIY